MIWRVGQKVIRVNDKFKRRVINPQLGVVYTIREIYDFDGVGFVLAEIRNAPRLTTVGIAEPGFFAWRFRPVVEPEADISVFTSILDRINKREAVEA